MFNSTAETRRNWYNIGPIISLYTQDCIYFDWKDSYSPPELMEDHEEKIKLFLFSDQKELEIFDRRWHNIELVSNYCNLLGLNSSASSIMGRECSDKFVERWYIIRIEKPLYWTWEFTHNFMTFKNRPDRCDACGTTDGIYSNHLWRMYCAQCIDMYLNSNDYWDDYNLYE